jgi:chitinase
MLFGKCGGAFAMQMRDRIIVAGRPSWVIRLALGWLACALPAQAALWTTAYYPGYEQAGMAASNIDFTALTQVIHFSLTPNADGTLNAAANGITTSGSVDLVARAHAAGKQVLICVGGAGTETAFQGATSDANRTNFINNVVSFMSANGYDGVDVDWEPLPVSDAAQFTNFVNGLRTALNNFPRHKLLTAAAQAYPVYGDPPAGQYAMYASLQAGFDQINVMAYDLSGSYDGWITWFNSPIYDGGATFASTGGLLPSVDGAVNNFLSNGVAPAKLGIALPFYGYVWSGGSGGSVPPGGVNQPRQNWTKAPSATPIPYTAIMDTYYHSNCYFWDTTTQAAYLSVSNGGNRFISFDDQHSCQAKVSYARSRGLGGIMIWELGLGYFPSRPAGQRLPLLQNLKQALLHPGLTSLQPDNRGNAPESHPRGGAPVTDSADERHER